MRDSDIALYISLESASQQKSCLWCLVLLEIHTRLFGIMSFWPMWLLRQLSSTRYPLVVITAGSVTYAFVDVHNLSILKVLWD